MGNFCRTQKMKMPTGCKQSNWCPKGSGANEDSIKSCIIGRAECCMVAKNLSRFCLFSQDIY